MLNSDQQLAITKLNQWWQIPCDQNPSFTLSGSPGVGKSFVVTHWLKQLNTKAWMLAPTNQAVKILQGFATKNGLNLEVTTLHSALGMLVKEGAGKFKIRGTRVVKDSRTSVESVGGVKFNKSGRLIIVDESYLLSQELEEELIQAAKPLKLKILFLGDPYQLPPVKGKPCKAFSSPDSYELTKVVRYDGGSLKIATYLRDVIKYNKPKINIYDLMKEQDILDSRAHNVFLLDKDEWLQKIKENLYADYKILAYRNDKVIEYNNYVRGLQGYQNPIKVGEQLISKKNHRVGKANFKNGEIVEVASAQNYEIRLVDQFPNYTKDSLEELTLEPEQFLRVAWDSNPRTISLDLVATYLESLSEPKNQAEVLFANPENLHETVTEINQISDIGAKLDFFSRVIYLVADYAKHKSPKYQPAPEIEAAAKDIYEYLLQKYENGTVINAVLKKLLAVNSKIYHAGKEFKQIKFLTYDFNYANAMTVHSSQGSTFELVFIDVADILPSPQWARLLYVAMTRASKAVYLLA